jgi:hypothetical protein
MAHKYIPYHVGMLPTGHQVSPERLEEFRCIYKEAFGEEISTQEAVAMTHRLLALYKALLRPLPSEVAAPARVQLPSAQSANE